MSTRSTTHFIETDPATGKVYTHAIVYRHTDGYPKGAGVDLCRFITKCKALQDNRLSDPSYLSAKYVVFLAEMYASDAKFQSPDGKLHQHAYNFQNPDEKRKYIQIPRKNRLDFISVGIVSSDPGDIEYRYVVDCSKKDPKDPKRPELKCFKVHSHRVPNTQDDWTYTYEEVAIPGRTKVSDKALVEGFINEHIVSSETGKGHRTTLAWECFKFPASW